MLAGVVLEKARAAMEVAVLLLIMLTPIMVGEVSQEGRN